MVVSLIGLLGCTPALDQNSVKAGSQIPLASQVQEISIPADPSLPRFAVVVEPLRLSRSSISGNTIVAGRLAPIHFERSAASAMGDSITAQLTTALSNIGNIALLEDRYAKLLPGERGPYVLQGTVTEINETAEGSSDSKSVSLGLLGTVLGVSGAVTGKPGLIWSGTGIAGANPHYRESEAKRTGMVALDFRLIDANHGRIIKAFSSTGTFSAINSANGFSIFGIGGDRSASASSALGQATRVAVNEAAEKTLEYLRLSRER